MKILHLVGGIGTSSGTTQIIWNLSRVAADEGHSPFIAHLSGRGIDEWRLPDSRISTRSFPVRWHRGWGFSPTLYRFLKQEGSSFDVMHVHSNWLYVNLAATATSLVAGRPLVVSPQGALDPWCLHHHAIRKAIYWILLEWHLMNRTTAIHAVSSFEETCVRQMGVRRPCTVIPNGVSPPSQPGDRDAARAGLGLPANGFIMLHLARLNPKKGLSLLIKTLSYLPETVPYHLLVAGSDGGSGYERVLRRQAAPLEKLGRITWLGEVSGPRKDAAFAAADVYVLPSKSEGMPIAALEALSHGVPVILSQACHIPEVEQAGAGFISPTLPEPLGRHILQLVYDPDLRQHMSRQARWLAAQTFDWNIIGRRMTAFYQSLLT